MDPPTYSEVPPDSPSFIHTPFSLPSLPPLENRMATLSGKTILIVGGSSGIGYGVAKASLLSQASKVIIASSSQTKIESALERLKADLSAAASAGATTTIIKGRASGEVVDARDSKSVKALLERVGELDHLVWTSGDELKTGFPNIDLDANKDFFDVRFWGPATAAQVAKIRPGGSITLTIGQVVVRPHKGWSLVAGVAGAVDSLTRGLALDLAPTRVNVVSPGVVKTELWDPFDPQARDQIFKNAEDTLLVRHVGEPDEIAEAYTFLMKCSYITGQRIEVDGGGKYI